MLIRNKDLTVRLGKSMFVATEGWFSRWLKRQNIHYLKPHGEQGDAVYSVAGKWLRDVLPTLISKYTPCDPYNADKMSL